MFKRLWNWLIGKPDISSLEIYELLAQSLQNKQFEIDYLVSYIALLENRVDNLEHKLEIN